MKPFANETESHEIGGLTFENHVDQLVVYGNAILTLDKPGYAAALKIKKLLDAACAVMAEHDKAGTLPDAIAYEPDKTDTIANPFAPNP